jgi:hypothetical protein
MKMQTVSLFKAAGFAATGAFALLVASAAAAQPYGMPCGTGAGAPAAGPPAFAAIDSDGDGLVSADELALHRATRIAARSAEGRMLRNAGNAPAFESLDLDGDGMLSAAELDRGRQARLADRGAGYGAGYGPGYRAAAGAGAGRAAGGPCPRRP